MLSQTSFQYLNFDLLLYKSGNDYAARVTASSGANLGSVTLRPVDTTRLRAFLHATGIDTRHLQTAPAQEMADLIDPKRFGEVLFASLYDGPLGHSLRARLQEANDRDCNLRIRLLLDRNAPDLAEIPWEFLYFPDQERFLTRSAATPIVRAIDGLLDAKPLAITLPLRILAVLSNPKDIQQLQVKKEWERLREALKPLCQDGRIELDKLENPTRDRLQERLLKNDVHVFHYIGHGYFDSEANQGNGEGGLVIEDAQGNRARLSAEGLAELLQDKSRLRLVFLNACEGARTSHTDAFTGTAQKLIQRGIPAVIAMQFPISDNAAIQLSQWFYKSVAAGYPLDAALSEARKAMLPQSGNQTRVEWATPAFFSRSPDNVLFTLPANTPSPTVLPQPLQKLYDILTQSELSNERLFDFYKRSLPDLVQSRAKANLHEILYELWELPEREGLVATFVKLLLDQANITPTLQTKLQQWFAQWQTDHAASLPNKIVTPPADKHAHSDAFKTCLQIELCPHKLDPPGGSEKHYNLRISLTQAGQIDPWHEDEQPFLLAKLPQVLLDLLESGEKGIPSDAAIEFLVPYELFDKELENWEFDQEDKLTLGKNYPVVVRSLDRMNVRNLSKKALWLEKWQKKWSSFQQSFEQELAQGLKWSPPSPDYETLGDELEQQAKTGAVGLNALPATPATFRALIRAGIPVAFWPKVNTQAIPNLEATILEQLKGQKLGNLPNSLLGARKAKIQLISTLVLLWDDPNRIPLKYRPKEGALR